MMSNQERKNLYTLLSSLVDEHCQRTGRESAIPLCTAYAIRARCRDTSIGAMVECSEPGSFSQN